MKIRFSLDWFLVFVPVTVGLEYLRPTDHVTIFVCACLAILPLAGWLGHATEHLAAHTGEGVGGLLNATFGNAAELIIAMAALEKGLHDVVKASLTGSIIGNILLVAGASTFAGGLKYRIQRFQATAARTQSTLLTLAGISLVVPAMFHHLAGAKGIAKEGGLSVEISVVLLLIYTGHLIFSLVTHKQLFKGLPTSEETESRHDHHPGWSVGKSVGVLAVATAFIAWMSEILVGSVEQAAHTFGMTSVFVGVIVVAIIGNAAEHSTAILMAMKNRMDLSLSIAIGSSIQVALFVAPILVLASQFVGPRPMDLVFSPAEVLAVVLSVVIVGEIASDGESNWLEGAMLLAVYVILGISFYFLPEMGSHEGITGAAQAGAGH
ncbi:calcium/proton exchanger [uncultured Paludibaculum sp.]|uniref:calcium/proton exchanger n=1 Tax=uncultured Paludibaculum sp. TaxID=1765020 RepID=UPI002AAA8DE6|nr:calcium/proton exchanger [uncultured Paludibaculum sp.]